jgi:phage gp16-like protein
MSYSKSSPKSSITSKQISVIKLAQGQLGIGDDDYRALLQDRFRVKSCKDLTFNQAGALIEELKVKGFDFIGRDVKSDSSLGKTARAGNEPQDQKIRAMWLTLYDCGIIRDPLERAMLAFVKRQTGRDALPWCSVAEKQNVIEALKKMGER